MKQQFSELKLSKVSSLIGYRWLLPACLAVFLIIVSFNNYLLFHVLAELFTIVIAILFTVVVWQTYSFSRNHYLLYLGCGYLWIAALDLVHTLVYKGMAIYLIADANPATQFWISARYFEALLLLSAPFFINRSFNRHIVFALFAILAITLYTLIMSGYFPDAFIEGIGLTRFKIISEYIIIGLLFGALIYIWLRRQLISSRVLFLITASIALTIFSELAFTFYVSVYGLSNLVGHIGKLFSYWFIFEAVVYTTLKEPVRVMNQNLLNEIDSHKTEQEKFSLLLRSTAEGIYGIDTEGKCTFANPACIRILAFDDEQQLIGKNMHDLIHHSKVDGSHYPQEECHIYQSFRIGKGIHINDEFFWRQDGSSFYAEYWSYPIHQEGSVIGAVVTFFDITTQKQVETERKQLHHDMGERIKELQCIYNVTEAIHARDTLQDVLYDIVKLIPAGWHYPEYTKARIIYNEQEYIDSPFALTEWQLHSELIINAQHRGSVEVYYTRQFPELDEGPFLQQERLLIDNIAKTLSDAIERKEVYEHLELMQYALDNVADAAFLINKQARIQYANKGAVDISGYSRDELKQMKIDDVKLNFSREEWFDHWHLLQKKGSLLFDTNQLNKDGKVVPVEINESYIQYQNQGLILAFVRNISRRKRQEQIIQLRQHLAELVYKGDQNQLMQAALDVGEKMTDSQIGFFHFVYSDQENLSLQVWSSRTLKEMCFAEGNDLHYPISEAGVWVDCIHQRQAVIHNDYNALPHKKGLPEGHPALLRELTVPIFREGRIVAVMGVGNKTEEYSQQDLDVLNQISDLAYDYVERKQAEEKIEFMAYYDVLTSQPNRQLLADRMQQAIAASHRSQQLLAICYLDLDRFKPINDRYGHHVGDALLIEVSRRINEGLREGDTLARLGGDEFAILLCGLSTSHECEEVVQRILDKIKLPMELEGHRLHVTGSIGITLYPTDDSDPDTLLRHADQAMYQAKESGEFNYQLYQPVQDQKLTLHLRELEQFDHALHHGQLLLYYQPKIKLRSGEVVGVEALIRWQHPEKGLQVPGQFLSLIEDTPLEISMGEWVVKTALAQLDIWQKQGLSLTMSINISPRQMQLGGFADFLQKELVKYPDSIAHNLELEVLETVAVGDTHQATEVMNACAKLGVSFALDDFGTGYSSLTYFHRLPIDVLKVDQNFVRDMLDEPQDLDIVEGVLKLAETLKRPVVAEGVETVELGLMLLGMGCQYAQGYGIARPMMSELVPEWLLQWHANSVWHQLHQEVSGDARDFALDVAIFSHKHWLNQIKQYIQGESEVVLPSLDASKCQFSHWYKGIGKQRFGSRPVYPFILPKHTSVHKLAQLLCTLVAENKRDQALSQFRELDAHSEELISILRQLSIR